MDNNGIPSDIVQILEYIAAAATGYDNSLKWNEIAMLKSDMMLNAQYWEAVTTAQIIEKCNSLGMRSEDVDIIADLHKRRLAGRRLVPEKGYRGFTFCHS